MRFTCITFTLFVFARRAIAAVVLAFLICMINNPLAAQEELEHFENPPGINQPNDMSIVIQSIAGIDVNIGDEIACFTEGGIIGGAVKLESTETPWGMALWPDDPSTGDTIPPEGFVEGESFRFVYWSKLNDWELEMESVDVISGPDTFTPNTYSVLDIVTYVDLDVFLQPAAFRLLNAYPNPFNNKINLSINVDRPQAFTVSLHNLVGRIIFHEVYNISAAGIKVISLQPDGLASGAYIVRVVSENGHQFNRSVQYLK